jgi:hypothetical protein
VTLRRCVINDNQKPTPTNLEMDSGVILGVCFEKSPGVVGP